MSPLVYNYGKQEFMKKGKEENTKNIFEDIINFNFKSSFFFI